MSIEVKLPELGENISSGDLLKVLVKVGEKINKDQALLELETDKAAIEVPSPTSGVVRQIHVKEGQKLKVGQVIISLDENGAKPPEPQRTPETFAAGIGQGGRPPIEQPLGKGIETRTATATTPAPGNGQQAKPAAAATGGTRTTEVKLPELGENVAGGDLLKVLVKAGDQINKEQALLEIETDKAAIEVPSPIAGLVKQVHVQPGQKIKVGQLIFTVEESGAAACCTAASDCSRSACSCRTANSNAASCSGCCAAAEHSGWFDRSAVHSFYDGPRTRRCSGVAFSSPSRARNRRRHHRGPRKWRQRPHHHGRREGAFAPASHGIAHGSCRTLLLRRCPTSRSGARLSTSP